MRSLLFVPDKYAAVVYKLHIAIGLVGNVIHLCGLYLGKTPDPFIWERTAGEHSAELLAAKHRKPRPAFYSLHFFLYLDGGRPNRGPSGVRAHAAPCGPMRGGL